MNGNKDSYDEVLRFSRITQENWLMADRKDYVPFGATKKEWAEAFLGPKLGSAVPQDVFRCFEIARGCMIYAWFFYPLATLGVEQCTRVGEFAVKERCRLLTGKAGTFRHNLAMLGEGGVISDADERRWQALRALRNSRSHLSSVMLLDPVQAVDSLQLTADLINGLFVVADKHSM